MLKSKDCVAWGLLGLVLAVAGQFLTVHANYGGDPTALFYTAQHTVIPAEISEDVFRAPDAEGFDGQFYHLIAHDPFLDRGFLTSVDNPRLRWRRILVPLTAFLLALGQDGWIDIALLAVTAAFTFAGIYWLARLAKTYHLHPACGLLFLTLPAVFISLERMTVDIALAALTAAFALYRKNPGWKLFAVLAAAPLARETGVILIAAYCFHELVERNTRRLAFGALTGLPFAAWTVYVHTHTPSDATVWAATFPFSGLVRRTLDPFPYEITGRWVGAAAVTDLLGILAIWMGLAAVVYLLRKKAYDVLTFSGVGFVLLCALLGKADVWGHAYGFSRIFSPWFVLLAVAAMERKVLWMLAPWALSVPRVVVQSWVHIPGVVSGLLTRRS